VQEDYEANDRYEQKLDEQGWAEFPRFLATAFFLAIERRFKGRDIQADVIRFVADLRATSPDAASILDAQATELVVRAVLDPAVTFDLDQTTLGKIQTMVTHKILSAENLSPDELDTFLGEAEELATGRG
jgi:hypothetical protein